VGVEGELRLEILASAPASEVNTFHYFASSIILL
jgi:hypothetical protein